MGSTFQVHSLLSFILEKYNVSVVFTGDNFGIFHLIRNRFVCVLFLFSFSSLLGQDISSYFMNSLHLLIVNLSFLQQTAHKTRVFLLSLLTKVVLFLF